MAVIGAAGVPWLLRSHAGHGRGSTSRVRRLSRRSNAVGFFRFRPRVNHRPQRECAERNDEHGFVEHRISRVGGRCDWGR